MNENGSRILCKKKNIITGHRPTLEISASRNVEELVKFTLKYVVNHDWIYGHAKLFQKLRDFIFHVEKVKYFYFFWEITSNNKKRLGYLAQSDELSYRERDQN